MNMTINSRWWETYLVRYVTGSVVGAVIVYVLLKNIGIDLIANWSEIQSTNMVVLGVLGFAYCYLASAPITLLHAVRAVYVGFGIFNLEKAEDETENAKLLTRLRRINWKYFGSLLLTILLFSGLGLATYPSMWTIFAAVGMTLFLFYALPLRMLLLTLSTEEWQRWYFRLAKCRAEDARERKEIVESYRHLREHGNAFLIVIMEILLGVILFSVAKLLEKNGMGAGANEAIIGLMVMALIYWIGAGAACWFLANRLENFMLKMGDMGSASN